MPNCYENMCCLADESEDLIADYNFDAIKSIRRYTRNYRNKDPMDAVFFEEYIETKKVIYRAQIFKRFGKILRACLRRGCNDTNCALHYPNGANPYFMLIKKKKMDKENGLNFGVFLRLTDKTVTCLELIY
ncbi:hypothetical protein CDAR_65331 [Caerostris darwini]|uniref:Uncharacterized protein n=1 Tax=Caerostris darwini TaxID=1538125 RepID=A0AAV4QBJ7_9ARAC|nr:hypothetical protein CDAR_65331 [Caerostris darwini]